MANLSEWLGRLAEAPFAGGAFTEGAPGWIALLEEGAGFREALPFGEPEVAAPPERSEPLPNLAAQAGARAFADGEAAGRAAAQAEAAEHTARQRALRLNFRNLDEAALGLLAEDLAATVTALAQGVLGEAAIDCEGLLARCQAAARRIGGAANALALHLHPEDVAMLGEEALAGWRIVHDAGLDRGSLRIEGPDGSVGDGIEEWRRAIAAAVRG